MKTLEKMGAVIDVCGRWLVLSHISPDVKIPLAKSKAGHLLVNLTMDWLNVSQPLKTESATRAYMDQCELSLRCGQGALGQCRVRGESCLSSTIADASHMSTQCTVGKVWMMESSEDDLSQKVCHEPVVLMVDDHVHRPLPVVTQAMRDQILHELVTSSGDSCVPRHAAQEDIGHCERQGQESSSRGEVRLVENRGPRPSRSEDTGTSMSWRACGSAYEGANAFARWTGCQACGLRLSYTPTWGSHGLNRQAGPLHADTKVQIEEKKPEKGSVDLVNRKIGYDAQERGIENQLNKVQEKKAAWLAVQELKDSKANKVTKEPEKMNAAQQSRTTAAASSATISPGQPPIDLTSEEMHKTPGRKSRKSEETSEELEYSQRSSATTGKQ